MKAELACNAGGPAEYPADGLTEVAVLGRSNVGKSSLLNVLVGRRDLARTSGTPGKTRRIHFYRIGGTGGEFYLVDLPGYGYAAVSRAERQGWRAMAESYLRKTRGQLRGAILVVDIRRGCQEQEAQLLEWLAHEEVPVGLAFTKSDKLTRSAQAARLPELARSCAPASERVCAVSSRTGAGFETLVAWIVDWTGCKLRTREPSI